MKLTEIKIGVMVMGGKERSVINWRLSTLDLYLMVQTDGEEYCKKVASGKKAAGGIRSLAST